MKVVRAESTPKRHPTALETAAGTRLLTGQAQARFGGCPRWAGALVGTQCRVGAAAGDAGLTEAAC